MNWDKVTIDSYGDAVCKHGVAVDVHCCNCHSGFFPPDDCCCTDDDDASETVPAEDNRELIIATNYEVGRAVDRAFPSIIHQQGEMLK